MFAPVGNESKGRDTPKSNHSPAPSGGEMFFLIAFGFPKHLSSTQAHCRDQVINQNGTMSGFAVCLHASQHCLMPGREMAMLQLGTQQEFPGPERSSLPISYTFS